MLEFWNSGILEFWNSGIIWSSEVFYNYNVFYRLRVCNKAYMGYSIEYFLGFLY